MRIRVFIGLAISFLVSCSQKPPVSFEDANEYQKAIYYNNSRPSADAKRDNDRKPAEILAFAGVKSGDIVIDLLGGGGWYTELLSNVVGPKGKVYIVNPPLFINFSGEELTERLKKNRLTNVVRVDAPWNNLNLPTNVDVIWLALSYHDIYVKRPNQTEFEADRDHFFEQMRKALKPGGLLLVTDHAASPGSGIDVVSSLHRIDEEFTKQDFEKEGFELLRTTDVLRNPNDDYSKDIWNEAVFHNTDVFTHLYKRK